MTRQDYDRLCADADELATFTTEELRQRGWTRYTVAAAAQEGLLEVVGTVDNGLPGRNPYKLQITAKGKRRARQHREYLEELIRWGSDAG